MYEGVSNSLSKGLFRYAVYLYSVASCYLFVLIVISVDAEGLSKCGKSRDVRKSGTFLNNADVRAKLHHIDAGEGTVIGENTGSIIVPAVVIIEIESFQGIKVKGINVYMFLKFLT